MTDQTAPAPEEADEELWAKATAQIFEGAAPAETPEPEAAAEAAPEQDADPWANAPEPLRLERDALLQKTQELEQKWNSDKGRLAPMSRKINELQEQLAALEAARKEPPQDVKALISELEDDYPEIGQKLNAMFGVLDERISSISTQTQAAQEAAAARAAALAEAKLTEKHPDWLDVTSKPEWASWVDDQPRRIRDIIAANAEAITDPEGAAEAIGLFKASITPPDPNPDTKRARQLAASASPPPNSRSIVAEPPDPTDEVGLWNAATKRIFGKG